MMAMGEERGCVCMWSVCVRIHVFQCVHMCACVCVCVNDIMCSNNTTASTTTLHLIHCYDTTISYIL